MKSLPAATFSHAGSPASRRPLVRLLRIAPAALLLCGLFTVWAGPLAAPAAAAAKTGLVAGWGYNVNGDTNAPAGLSGVIAIAAAGYSSLALKSDGTVVAWGDDAYGQTDVPAGLSGVTAIAAGADHCLAMKSDGTVVAWGSYGETTPPAGLSGVIAISGGYAHSLALKSNGTVVAWGDDYDGATDVPAGLSGVTAIAAGNADGLALKSNGTVVAWGDDEDGRTTVPAGLSGVTAIAAGGSHSLALEPGAATHLSVSVGMNPYPVGSTHSVTVSARDPYGDIAPAYRGTIHFTSSDPKATLPADYTFTAADAGVHKFPNTLSPGLTLKTAGSESVTATDATFVSVTGSRTVTVTPPGAATHLSVSVGINPYPVGSTHSVTVTARDAYGTVATGYRGTIHFTSSDAKATLPADYTFTAADAGIHKFGYSLNPALTLETAGSQSVTATDKATASITGSQTVTVFGAATHLTVGTFNPYPVGVTHSVTVKAYDAYGNVASGYLGTIHFTSSDTAATLPADYTFTAADKGVHTFTGGLVLNTVGSQWVRATDKTTASITGSQTVTVT